MAECCWLRCCDVLQPQACNAHLGWLLTLRHLQPCLAPCDSDHYAHATTGLYKLRGLLQAAAGGVDAAAPAWALAMSAQDASWRVEEAKLLWAQGQQDTAVQLARSLLGARCELGAGLRLRASVWLPPTSAAPI